MDFEHCTMDVNYGHVLHADVEVETVDASTRRLGALATWPQSIEQLDVNFGAVATSSSRSRCTTIEVAMCEGRTRDVQASRSRRGSVERAACERSGRVEDGFELEAGRDHVGKSGRGGWPRWVLVKDSQTAPQ